MEQSYLSTVCFDVYYHRIFQKITEDDINTLGDAYNSFRKIIKEYRRLQAQQYGVSRFDVLRRVKKLSIPNLVKYLSDIKTRHRDIIELVFGTKTIPHFISEDVESKRLPTDCIHYKEHNIYSSKVLSSVDVFVIGGSSTVYRTKMELVRKLCALFQFDTEETIVVTCKSMRVCYKDLPHATWCTSLPYQLINSYYELVDNPKCNVMITDESMVRPWTHGSFLKLHKQWKATKGSRAKIFYTCNDSKDFNAKHHNDIFETMMQSEDVVYAKVTVIDEYCSIMTHNAS